MSLSRIAGGAGVEAGVDQARRGSSWLGGWGSSQGVPHQGDHQQSHPSVSTQAANEPHLP